MDRKSTKFEREYFSNLIDSYVKWESDEKDLEAYFEGVDYMGFPIKFANDCSVILDAGEYNIYIEWGINECPVYVDMPVSTYSRRHPNTTEYTRIGRIRNARFWALADRFKNRR